MSEVKSQKGIILKKSSFGDFDEIITVLLEVDGLQRFFAKSAKKSKKRFGNQLDLFNHLKFYYKEKEGLWSLNQVEGCSETPRLAIDEDILLFAYLNYLAELVLEYHKAAMDSSEVYSWWMAVTYYFSKQSFSLIEGLRFFLSFLSLCGYHFETKFCVSCKTTEAGYFTFSSVKGGVLCDQCLSVHDKTSFISRKVLDVTGEYKDVKEQRDLLTFTDSEELFRQVSSFAHHTIQKKPKSFDFFCQLLTV